MTIKINYFKNQISKTNSNTILFVNEKFNIKGLKKNFSKSEFTYVDDLLKTSDLKKNLIIFEIN